MSGADGGAEVRAGADMPPGDRINPSDALPVLRAPMSWYGGKASMLPILHRLVPPGGRPYCEPCAGAASLLLSREPAPVEVLNDIDGDVVNLFRCLQDRALFDDLKHRLTYTLYARSEYQRALAMLADAGTDPVSRAWATFVYYNGTINGGTNRRPKDGRYGYAGSWARAFTPLGGMAETANKWLMRLSLLDAFRLRLQRVQIDNRDASVCLSYWDADDAVVYIDPPYVAECRSTDSQAIYRHEMAADQHQALLIACLSARGAVVISGYDSPLYAPLDAAGWTRHTFSRRGTSCGGTRRAGKARADVRQAGRRTEVIWLNPRAAEAAGGEG